MSTMIFHCVFITGVPVSFKKKYILSLKSVAHIFFTNYIFSHLKSWITVPTHNFKWLNFKFYGSKLQGFIIEMSIFRTWKHFSSLRNCVSNSRFK